MNVAVATAQYEQLLHKSYAECRPSLDSCLSVFEKKYPQVEAHFAAWEEVKAFARKQGDRRLEVMGQLFRVHVYRYHYMTDEPAMIDSLIMYYQELYDAAEKIAFPEVQALCLKSMAEAYYWQLANYDASFDCCYRMSEILEHIPDKAFPDKKYCLYFIGTLYRRFQEYETAMAYFRRAMEVQVDMTVDRLVNDQMTTFNSIGGCFFQLGMPDSSAYYYQMIIDEKIIPDNHVWKVIARSNLGECLYKRGDYTQAIPLLMQAVENMPQYDDYGFAAASAVILAMIHMQQDQLPEAYRLLQLADRYRDRAWSLDWMRDWYAGMSRYFLLRGQVRQSALYQDSVIMAERDYYKKNNALQLLRTQQHQWALEHQLQEEALMTEQLHNDYYRKGMAWLFFSAIVLLIGGGICLLLYTRKRAAYRELARKSKEWAKAYDLNHAEESAPVDEVNSSQAKLMEQVYEQFDRHRLFTESDLSLSMLADLLDTNRSYLSDTINRTTGKHFNQFVNEYRVKEAVRKLSDPACDKYSIDQIAADTGFATRKTLYEVFKRSTGLSPSDFKKNRDGEA